MGVFDSEEEIRLTEAAMVQGQEARRASWTSMTMAELNKFCQDPLKLFKKVMQ